MAKHRIYATSFASVYPLYVAKAEKKGRTKAEVDQVMAQAALAGATIADAARDRFFGRYAGYFRDPDGHLWEIAWMDPVAVEKGPAEFAAEAS